MPLDFGSNRYEGAVRFVGLLNSLADIVNARMERKEDRAYQETLAKFNVQAQQMRDSAMMKLRSNLEQARELRNEYSKVNAELRAAGVVFKPSPGKPSTPGFQTMAKEVITSLGQQVSVLEQQQAGYDSQIDESIKNLNDIQGQLNEISGISAAANRGAMNTGLAQRLANKKLVTMGESGKETLESILASGNVPPTLPEVTEDDVFKELNISDKQKDDPVVQAEIRGLMSLANQTVDTEYKRIIESQKELAGIRIEQERLKQTGKEIDLTAMRIGNEQLRTQALLQAGAGTAMNVSEILDVADATFPTTTDMKDKKFNETTEAKRVWVNEQLIKNKFLSGSMAPEEIAQKIDETVSKLPAEEQARARMALRTTYNLPMAPEDKQEILNNLDKILYPMKPSQRRKQLNEWQKSGVFTFEETRDIIREKKMGTVEGYVPSGEYIGKLSNDTMTAKPSPTSLQAIADSGDEVAKKLLANPALLESIKTKLKTMPELRGAMPKDDQSLVYLIEDNMSLFPEIQ